MVFICTVAADFWCCLGSTSTDRTSDDYYYVSTNVSNHNASPENCSSENAAPNIPSGSISDDQPAVVQESCQPDSSTGISSDAACVTAGGSSTGCDSGWGDVSGGGFDSGGDGGCD